MTIEKRIENKKLQHDIKREAAEIQAFPLGKIEKCEYLTGDRGGFRVCIVSRID